MTIFDDARAIDDPDARASYLDRACGQDADLRRRVGELLAADAAADGAGFLDPPAEDRTGTFDPGSPITSPAPGTGAGLVIGGRYTLVEPIGEGGMGNVWAARQTEPVKREVAVKLIKSGMDSRAVLARFEAERQALALMNHPNIAKVFDAGTTAAPDPASDGRPYFVMELVRGLPITDFCDKYQLGVRDRLGVFADVCRAVQHAHQKGVIHRDIKPTNVLVGLVDDRPVPKVIDFGVAKAAGEPLTDLTLATGIGVVVGTPAYMAPEQATFNNVDVDTRADVYSLGALLYELLAGTPPFPRAEMRKVGLLEVLRVVREVDPPRPSARLSTADGRPSIAAVRGTDPGALTRLLRSDLDWVVMKALDKDRGRRYDSATAFAADVDRYLAGEAVQAAPPSRAYRLRKLVHRNRRAAAAVAVLFATLAGTTVGWVRAEAAWAAEADQRRRADEQRKTAEAAQKAEAQQRRLADEEREVAAAVVTFMTEIFGQADAKAQAALGREPNPNLTVRKALERAAAVVGERFRDRPAVEAAVRRVLGQVYLNSGPVERAGPEFARAAELIERVRGADTPEHLAVLRELAHARLAGAVQGDAGQKDALNLFKRVLAGLERLLPPDDPLVLEAVRDLAMLYVNSVDRAEGIPLFRRVLSGRLRTLGPDHPSTLVAEYEYAHATQDVEAVKAAIPALERLRRLRADLQPSDPARDWVTARLVEVYTQWVDRYADAVPLLQERIAAFKQVSRDPGEGPWPIQSQLVVCYWALGRQAEAVELSEQIYAEVLKARGRDNEDTRVCARDLAEFYCGARQWGDATRVYERHLADTRTTYGPQNKATIRHLVDLLRALKGDKQLPRAAEVRAELAAAGRARRTNPEKPPVADPTRQAAADSFLAEDLRFLAERLLVIGEPALAEPLLRESRDLARGALADPVATRRAATAALLLGRALLDQVRPPKDAEVYLREAEQAFKGLEIKHPGRFGEQLDQVTKLLVRVRDTRPERTPEPRRVD